MDYLTPISNLMMMLNEGLLCDGKKDCSNGWDEVCVTETMEIITQVGFLKDTKCFLSVPLDFHYPNENNLFSKQGVSFYCKLLENIDLVCYNSFFILVMKIGRHS